MSKSTQLDFTKVCWYCHGSQVFPLHSWYVCKSCGATWNEVQKPGMACVTFSDHENDRVSAYHSVPIPERRNRRGSVETSRPGG